MKQYQKLAVLLVVCLLPWSMAEARGQRCKEHKPETTPGSDFVIHKDGTATHKKTGLMWKRCVEGMQIKAGRCRGDLQKVFWSDVFKQYQGVKFAAYSDWRAPTIDELKTIVEKRCKSPALNLSIFPDAPNLQAWSASGVEGQDGKAWQMYTASGVALKANKAASASLRLVRKP